MTIKNAIECIGLGKEYKASGKRPAKVALQAIDLGVPTGSMFALLGPNGAGKSTLINILAGMVYKTAGKVSIWGLDIDTHMRQAKYHIGIVPQELNMDPFFTPREVLEMHAGMYGVAASKRRTMNILDSVGLADKADAYARTLSGGMRRRLMVAKAMVHSPNILVLDEPTAGVDVDLRRQLWANVQELNRQGTTILLTTHYLEEAQELCDRIGIINHGKLIVCDTTKNLLKRLDHKTLTVQLASAIVSVPEGLAAYSPELLEEGSALRFSYQPSKANVAAILEACRDANLTIRDLSTSEADLEDIFLNLTRAG